MPAFLLSPLFKWGASILGVIALLGGVWFGIQHAIKKHDDGVRAEVTNQVKIDALTTQAKNAEEDRKFADEVFQAQAQDNLGLSTQKQNTATRIKKAQNDISGKIADGSLVDRPASELLLQGIAQVDAMYAERKEKAAAQ